MIITGELTALAAGLFLIAAAGFTLRSVVKGKSVFRTLPPYAAALCYILWVVMTTVYRYVPA